MEKNALLFLLLCIFPLCAIGQSGEDINITDQTGKKQGLWIKKYPNGNIQYEGIFKNDHPVGEFKRYSEDKRLQ